MPLTRLSLSNPAAVCVGIALIVLMGAMAFLLLAGEPLVPSTRDDGHTSRKSIGVQS